MNVIESTNIIEKTGKNIAIFDVDNTLLDMWNPMWKMYDEFFNTKTSEQEWVNIIRDFDNDPTPYIQFGIAFQGSVVFETLPPVAGMKELLVNLRNNNFDIVAISAAPNDDMVKTKRIKNLINEFDGMISVVHCIGSKNKKDLISRYAQNYGASMFCDDHPETVQQSVGIVTYPIWFKNKPHSHRLDKLDLSVAKIANNAKDIQGIVLGTGPVKTR